MSFKQVSEILPYGLEWRNVYNCLKSRKFQKVLDKSYAFLDQLSKNFQAILVVLKVLESLQKILKILK